MKSSPIITVLMPVYNGGAFLSEAVQSIIGQTCSDFEFLIIDDGSDDESLDVIQSFRDTRIHLVRNQTNKGLIYSLNKGLEIASGRFIARMDADDISLSNRLERQLAYMEAHPEIGITGTWSETFGAVERPWQTRFSSDHAAIVAHLIFNTAISHPTAMMRRDQLVANGLRYSEAAPHAEDYDLWVRASRILQLGNVPEVLFRYRVHGTQVSQVTSDRQRATADEVRQRLLSELGVDASSREHQLHSRIASYDWERTSSFYDDVRKWLRRIAARAAPSDAAVNAAIRMQCQSKLEEVKMHVCGHRHPLRRLASRLWHSIPQW